MTLNLKLYNTSTVAGKIDMLTDVLEAFEGYSASVEIALDKMQISTATRVLENYKSLVQEALEKMENVSNDV